LKTILVVLVVVGLASVMAGCPGSRAGEPEAATVSPTAAADYALFTIRCSKCHSLSRPLNSGIDNDDYWRLYVARMKRQPGSGISDEDEVAILRFLHVFSMEQRRKKAEKLGLEPPQEAPSSLPPSPAPPPSLPASQPDAASPSGSP
jgi:hypothetical protein